MRELALVQVVHGLVERSQQFEPLCCDACFHHATIIFLSFARDQRALLHAIEKPGHIGIMRNHPFGDAAAGQTVGLGAAKDAKSVVLRGGQIIRFQELFHLLAEAIGGFLHGDEGVSLKGRRRFGGARRVAHGDTIIVITTNVKTKKCGKLVYSAAQVPRC